MFQPDTRDSCALVRASMIAGFPHQKITRPEFEEEGLCKHFFAGSSQCLRNSRASKKRTCISFHEASCLHVKRVAVDVSHGNNGDSYFSTTIDASDKKPRNEYLWKEFFSDPALWWDNRTTKKSRHQPDFIHRMTSEALWIGSWLSPSWVKEKFATMAFDSIESSGRLTSRVPPSVGTYDTVQKLTCEGKLKEALHLLELSGHQTSEAPRGTFICLLRECTRRKALAEGKQVHVLILNTKCDNDIFLSNLLIGMYSACGSVAEALKVFTTMPRHNVFSWTAMISAYAKNREYNEAIAFVQQMHQEGIEPDEVACIVALKACTNIAALEQGRHLHSLILKNKFDSNPIIQTTLIDMYAKCGCLTDARELFDNMTLRDVVSWNAMITGYAREGLGKEALDLYEQMKDEHLEPNDVTLVLLLKACASIPALQQGKQLHFLVLQKGLESELIIQNTLVDMYSKCGCLKDAREMFDNMIIRDVVSWNAIIAAYAHEGLGKEALDLYEQMKDAGMEPNYVTILLLLKACARISALQQGKQLHSLILQNDLESELIMQNSLMDMYSKCGCLNDARVLFDNMIVRDVVSWNAMIAGYAQEGLGREALDLYEQMKDASMEPNYVTLVLLLKACVSISALQEGKQLHSFILQNDLNSELIVQNTLVDMYSKFRCLQDAREVFDNMTIRDVVSWNAMIAGYAQEGLGREALDLYEKMKDEGMEPDSITVVLLLKACASISGLQQGKQLHSLILQKGLDSELIIQNTLIDMYSKCGSLKDARDLFDKMTVRDVISWNVLISGYAQEGLGKEAFNLYEQMTREGLQANDVTYTCVLSACSHSGLVDVGHHVFESMSKDYGVTPTLAHYSCMVDLLSRAGQLFDAEDFILKMPILPSKVVWMSLLGAARNYTNVEIGRRAFEHCVELEPENAAAYLLIIDIYLAAGRVHEVAQLRKEMNDKGLEKVLGCSWIEVNNQVHTFEAGDSSHPDSKQVYAELKRLIGLIINVGYAPDLSPALTDMKEEDKEVVLSKHSEILAIAFGLISIPSSVPILVKKNLRMSRDCHNVTELISRVVGREITVMDADRLHYFKDGVCSCGGK